MEDEGPAREREKRRANFGVENVLTSGFGERLGGEGKKEDLHGRLEEEKAGERRLCEIQGRNL